MMNISSTLGILFGIGIVTAAIHESNMDFAFFLNFHGLVIVLGGTLAATSISFPLNKILALLKVFFLRVLLSHKANYPVMIQQILDLQKKASQNLAVLKEAGTQIRHPFLREAIDLVAAGVLTEPEIREALEQRVKTMEHRLMYEANMFRIIGRYPPAFGLLATTLGMIALLQQIGKPGSESLIGPSMSIGLVGTLYGIALANLVFIPIAENLTERTEEEICLRKMIIEGAIMLKKQVNPLTMRENLNSFAPPKERVHRKAG